MILVLDYNRIIERKEHTTMPDLMQTLFKYIIDHTLDTYCLQTKCGDDQLRRSMIYKELWDQLTEKQRELLEECDYHTYQIQRAELYAMFLAAFDQSAALSRRHIA